MILLLSHVHDYATDYVVAQLRESGAQYIRFDLDRAQEVQVALDPIRRTLRILDSGRETFITADSLRSVYYRAPTHLRESGGHRYPPAELLARHQWVAFARALQVFDEAVWVNNPRDTYRAESKPLQLAIAQRIGFDVPETRIANSSSLLAKSDQSLLSADGIAVKAVDTFFLRDGGEDLFFYTKRLPTGSLDDAHLSLMPVILQEFLTEKLDIRVTVVNEQCFAAEIHSAGAPIRGDWRLAKSDAQFSTHDLPRSVEAQCIQLARAFGLRFAAIDLAYVSGRYCFLEVNPTGEWAWLVETVGFAIDKAIAHALLG